MNISSSCQRCGVAISVESASSTAVVTCHYCHDELQVWADGSRRRLRDVWGKREIGNGSSKHYVPAWNYQPKSMKNLLMGTEKRK